MNNKYEITVHLIDKYTVSIAQHRKVLDNLVISLLDTNFNFDSCTKVISNTILSLIFIVTKY